MASSFVFDLWESIFTPGPTPSVLRATNASFAALQLVLVALLAATASVHFIVLSVLCAGLWWSVNWFAAELAVAQSRLQPAEPQHAAATEDGDDDTGDGLPTEGSSDTEVEGAPRRGVAAGMGHLRQRTALGPRAHLTPGTPSSASTEDEWEKISGSERDKSN